jgi:hypothetical protein
MPTIQEIVTPAVAAIGLGLSIYNTVQARRDKRPLLTVHVSFGVLVFGPELSDQKIMFDVGNGWEGTVTLASMCILSGKRTMAFLQLEGERQMPVALSPGMSTKFWMNCDQLAAETIQAGIARHARFQVMARDALGNEYLSNKVSFNPMK